jgi:hypothetical protein
MHSKSLIKLAIAANNIIRLSRSEEKPILNTRNKEAKTYIANQYRVNK